MQLLSSAFFSFLTWQRQLPRLVLPAPGLLVLEHPRVREPEALELLLLDLVEAVVVLGGVARKECVETDLGKRKSVEVPGGAWNLFASHSCECSKR